MAIKWLLHVSQVLLYFFPAYLNNNFLLIGDGSISATKPKAEQGLQIKVARQFLCTQFERLPLWPRRVNKRMKNTLQTFIPRIDRDELSHLSIFPFVVNQKTSK